MAKTSLEINDSKLKQAREILGTQTKRATVDAALDEVIRRRLRLRLLDRLTQMEGLDLDDAELMTRAWR